MKSRSTKTIVLLSFLLVFFSLLSLAQEETAGTGQIGGQPVPQAGDLQDLFENNPTPENFNKLPDPTAADLAKVPDPTLENFNHLNPLEQGNYLGQETNFDLHPEFAQEYYSDPLNWDTNPEVDRVLFTGTRFRDLLRAGTSQVSAAEQYFSNAFPADFIFQDIGDDFRYDQAGGMLYNGVGKVDVNNQKIKKVTAISDNNEFGLDIEGEGGTQSRITGAKDGGEKLIDFSDTGEITFTDQDNNVQSFTIAGEEKTKFNFRKDELEIDGEVSGIVKVDNENKFVDFRNRNGPLIIKNNGDIEARDALVQTAKFYAEGYFEYQLNGPNGEKHIVNAYDVMDNDRKTIVIDLDSKFGAKSQGQIKGQSKMTVHLSKVSPDSEYFQKYDPNDQPTIGDVINRLQEVRPPKGDIGGSAEVFIQTDSITGKTIFTCKGKVDCGKYDVITGSARLDEAQPHFIGINGRSEFDLLDVPQKQINIRGKAEYSDGQYSSVRTEDGASLKIIRNELNDDIYSGCFDCKVGSTAIDINKKIITSEKGSSVSPDFRTIKLSATVTEGGLSYNWDEFTRSLGFIASEATGGRETSLGRTMVMKNVACQGDKQCNFMLTKSDFGEVQSFYEVYDPQTNTVSKPVVFNTNIGKFTGREVILTSPENFARLGQIEELIAAGKYAEIYSALKENPFTDDPALRKHLMKTTGIDIQNLDKKEYTDKLSNIIGKHQQAQRKIDVLKNNYGIELDENGLPANQESQQKLNDVLNKGRTGEEIAVFDLYTGALVDLAQVKKDGLQAIHQSCAGTSGCPVSDEEVKQAEKERIAAVQRRERSPEGIRWKQDFELKKEQQKEAEELKPKLVEAKNLGDQRDQAERTIVRDQAVLVDTLQEISKQEAKVAQLEEQQIENFKRSVTSPYSFKGLTDVLTDVLVSDSDVNQEEQFAIEIAKKELSSLQEKRFSLQKRIENGKNILINTNNQLSQLTQDFDEPTSKLALLSAAGDDETIQAMVLNSNLPEEKKGELLRTYVGEEAAHQLIAIRADTSISDEERAKRQEAIIGSGKQALKRAQNFAEMYGDIAGSKAILDKVLANRPDLYRSPEYAAADNALYEATENKRQELREQAQQNLRDAVKRKEGSESSVFGAKNSVLDASLSAFGTGLEWVGDGIYHVSAKTIAGVAAVGGGAAYLVGADDTGESLIRSAGVLWNIQEIEEKEIDSQISLLNERVKSLDSAGSLIRDAQIKQEPLPTELLKTAFKDQAPIVNLAKQMEGQNLDQNDLANQALYEADQQALVVGSEYLVTDQYQAVKEQYYGTEASKIAEKIVYDARDTPNVEEEGFFGTVFSTVKIMANGDVFSKEDVAKYGPIAEAVVDVTNLIPGVVFVKAAGVVGKVAEVTKITKAVSAVSKAVEVVADSGKLLLSSKKAREAISVAKAELNLAKTAKGLTAAERIAQISSAERKLADAAQLAEAEYKAGKIGGVVEFTAKQKFHPLSSDLRALEDLRLAAQADTVKAAEQLRAAATVEELRTAQAAYDVAVNKVNDVEKAAQAFKEAGSKIGAWFERGTKKGQIAIGPQAEKAREALTNLQKVEQAYHAERAVVGADRVRLDTINNLIAAGKKAEDLSLSNRISSAIKGKLGAERVQRNIETLKAAKVSMNFAEDGRLLAEGIESGSAEAKLVEQTNKLLENDGVVRRILGEDVKGVPKITDVKPAPQKLTVDEFNELESIHNELSSRGANYEFTDTSVKVNIDDIPTENVDDLNDLQQKVSRLEQLIDQADKEDLALQINVRKQAEAILADEDLSGVAAAVKEDLTAKAGGEVGSGIIPEVVGEDASKLPKPKAPSSQVIGFGDDVPRPKAIEEAGDSASLGISSIVDEVRQEGKVAEAAGIDKLPEGITINENKQRVAGLLPDAGREVKVETVAGNVFDGTLVYKDDEVLYLEKFGEEQRIITQRVVDVEVKPQILNSQQEGLAVLRNRFEPLGARWEIQEGKLRLNLDDLTPDLAETPGFMDEAARAEELANSPGDDIIEGILNEHGRSLKSGVNCNIVVPQAIRGLAGLDPCDITVPAGVIDEIAEAVPAEEEISPAIQRVLDEESTRKVEEIRAIEEATAKPSGLVVPQTSREGLEALVHEGKVEFKKYNAGRRQLGMEPDQTLEEFVQGYVSKEFRDAGAEVQVPSGLVDTGIPRTGDERADTIIDVLEGRTSGELDAEELARLETASSLEIGRGAEGIVYEMPDGSVIKVKNTDSAISVPFREQARRLNALCEKGLAPCVSRSGEYFYQAEKVEFKSVKDAVLERLTKAEKNELDSLRIQLKNGELPGKDYLEQRNNYFELRANLIQRARDDGRFTDLEQAADDLFDGLKELNLEVLDTSWTNLHCANEECTKFAVVDVGASVSGERSRILQGGVAENYKTNLLTGKGQNIAQERNQEIVDEIVEASARERAAVSETPEAGEISGQIRLLTEAEVPDRQELEAWNEIVAAARSSEERLSFEQINRLEDNRLSVPEDDLYAITFDVPESARQSLSIDVEAVIKVQSDTPPQGVALVTDEADILSDLSEVAVPVLLRDDKYYVVQKFEGLRLDEMPADLRARIKPQIESFREALVAKGYEMDNYGGLVYDSLRRELKLTNPRVVKRSSLPPDELRDLHNQKIDDILNRGVVTPEEKAEALAEARRILEEEGAFARPPAEDVVVPQEAAATDLGSVNAGQDVKIRSREGLFEGSLLSKEGDNIIIETTEPRGGIFGAILPDRKIQQQIPLEDVIIYGEQVHIRSVSKRGVNRQELIGDVYVGNYLGENNAYLYLSVNGKPTRIHKANLDLGSLDKAIVSDPASEFILNQQKILDQVNRVPIVDGRQVLIVHVDPNSLRIQGVGAVPSEVSGNSVPVRMVVDAETGRIADVVGETRIAEQYKTALADKPLYGELGAVRSDIVDPCAVAGSAIHGLAVPCADVAVGRLEVEVPVHVSGVRITADKELFQLGDVGREELPINLLEENIVPERILSVQNVVGEADGIVIRSDNNLYFVNDEGIYPVGMDQEYSFRPKKSAGPIELPAEQNSALRTIYSQVKLNQRDVQELNSQDKFGLLLSEAAKDKKIQIQSGSGALDHLMINPFGTHENYLNEFNKVIENNDNLKYLHGQFKQKGIEPITTLKNPYPEERTDIMAAYNYGYEAVDGSFVEGSFTYRIFGSEEELLEYAGKRTGREITNLEEAKRLVADAEIKGIAGHESAHHAFHRMLDEGQKTFFTNHIWTTDDEAIVKAREVIISQPTYARKPEMSDEFYRRMIADEVFAYRLDFNMQGIGLHSDLSVLPSDREMAIFEQFGVLPPAEKRIPALVNNLALQPPQSFTDFTAEGQWFRARLSDGTSVEGRFSRIEGDEVVFARYERREGLLSWFLDDTIEPGTRISRNDFEPSSLIVGGRTNVRFSTSKGTFYGRYLGDSPDGIYLLDISEKEIIVSRKGLAKDSIIAQGEIIEIRAADNVAAYNGRYLAETETEIYLDVDGKVTKIDKKSLDLTTLQKKEFAEELVVPQVSAESRAVLREQILDDLVPEEVVTDVDKFLTEAKVDRQKAIHGASPELDQKAIDVHGSVEEYVEDFENLRAENPVLKNLHQNFVEKNIPEPKLIGTKPVEQKYAAIGSYNDGEIAIKYFVDDQDVLDYAKIYLDYKGNNLQEAKQIIAKAQLENMAGHELYHHTYQTFLTSEQKNAWRTFVSNNPDYQNAVRRLKDLRLDYSDKHIMEELFTHRMQMFTFPDSDIAGFTFIAKDQELQLLKDLDVLPADYRRPTRAVSTGESVKSKPLFELDGKKYYRDADNNWRERRSWYLRDHEVDDAEIEEQLYIAELNAVSDEISSRFMIDNEKLFAKNPSYTFGSDAPASEAIASKKVIFSDGVAREVYYSLNDRKVAEDIGIVYENVPHTLLKKGQGYTYVLLNDGSLIFGEIHDGLEFGVKHLHLANGRPVKAAGEIFIDESGRYLFNLESGSFTKVLIKKYRANEGLLREQMHDVFYRYFGQDGNHLKAVINRPEHPSLDELADLCIKNKGISLPICGSNRDIQRLIQERYPGVDVPEAIEPCAVAGGAISGLAGCLAISPNIIDLNEIEVARVSGTQEVGTEINYDWTVDQIKAEGTIPTPIPLTQERGIATTETRLLRDAYTSDAGTVLQQKEALYPSQNVQQVAGELDYVLEQNERELVFTGFVNGIDGEVTLRTPRLDPELGRLDLNLEKLFVEAKNSPEICKYMSCPNHYGLIEIDGVPYLASQKVEGTPVAEYLAKSDAAEITRVEKAIEKQLTKASRRGWHPRYPEKVRFEILRNGDVILVNADGWDFEEAGILDFIFPNQEKTHETLELIRSEAELAKISKPTSELISANKAVLGSAADDVTVQEALEELNVLINCKSTAFIGQAVSSCIPVTEVDNARDLDRILEINDLISAELPPIEITFKGENVADLESRLSDAQEIIDEQKNIEIVLSGFNWPYVQKSQVQFQVDDFRSLEYLAKEELGVESYLYQETRVKRLALDAKYNDPVLNPTVRVTSKDREIARSFQPTHKPADLQNLKEIIEGGGLKGPQTLGSEVLEERVLRNQEDSIFLSAGAPYSHIKLNRELERHDLPLLVFDREKIYENPTFKSTPRDSFGYSHLSEIELHAMNPDELDVFLGISIANDQVSAEMADFTIQEERVAQFGTFFPEITIDGEIKLDNINKIVLTASDKTKLFQELRDSSKFNQLTGKKLRSNLDVENILKENYGIEIVVPDEGLSVDQMYWKIIGQPVPAYG